MGRSPIHFIINPVAGRGRGERVVPLLREKMEAAGRGFELSLTSGPGEAAKLASLAAREAETVVAVGGDGTVNEVVNGLRGGKAVLGVIPVGSGNDFVKMVSVPARPEEALRLLLGEGEVRTVDIGVANDRLFTNSLSMGIDAAVARSMNRNRWLPGQLAYYYGVMTNLFLYRCRRLRWSADGEEGETVSLLAAAMNGTTYGGNFRVAPRARCDDGLLDMVVVGRYGLLGRARYLPVLKKGRHLGLPRITWRQVKRLRFVSDWPLPIQTDGELLPDSSSGTEVEVEVVKGGLKLITGRDAG